MSRTEITLISMVAICTLAVGVVAGYDEVRYLFSGRNQNGRVTSVDREFAGFSESQVKGTTPRYRTTTHYTFEVDGKTYRGISKSMTHLKSGSNIKVHYLDGDPSVNRISSLQSQATAAGFWIVGGILLGMCGRPLARHFIWSKAKSTG